MSTSFLQIANKIASAPNISLDELAYGENKAENSIKDNELLSLFVKTQDLSDNQKETVKDLLEAFIFKTNLKKELLYKHISFGKYRLTETYVLR